MFFEPAVRMPCYDGIILGQRNRYQLFGLQQNPTGTSPRLLSNMALNRSTGLEFEAGPGLILSTPGAKGRPGRTRIKFAKVSDTRHHRSCRTPGMSITEDRAPSGTIHDASESAALSRAVGLCEKFVRFGTEAKIAAPRSESDVFRLCN